MPVCLHCLLTNWESLSLGSKFACWETKDYLFVFLVPDYSETSVWKHVIYSSENLKKSCVFLKLPSSSFKSIAKLKMQSHLTQCCLLPASFISHGFECLKARLASAEQLLVVEPLNWPRIDHLLFLSVILLCINTYSSPLDSHQYVTTAPDNKGTRIKKKPRQVPLPDPKN